MTSPWLPDPGQQWAEADLADAVAAEASKEITAAHRRGDLSDLLARANPDRVE
ncbi:hypothetical protein [Frankia sp. AvcI1]|uniref:hypothetical protein n=1 Tax=Frankia sp. AvcI1 TaxID=573496 RepID=UPI000A973866|nr:hypothetical protein [Frankia sp. AvcI1]